MINPCDRGYHTVDDVMGWCMRCGKQCRPGRLAEAEQRIDALERVVARPMAGIGPNALVTDADIEWARKTLFANKLGSGGEK